MSTLKYMIPLAATLAACQPPEDPDVKVHVGKAKAALEAGRTTEAISALRATGAVR